MDFITEITKLIAQTIGVPFAWSDILRVLILVPTFLYASYTDFRTRRVNDLVWVPAIVLGTILALYDLSTGNPNILAPRILTNIVFMSVVGIILYKTRIFYGADFKALVVLGIALPTYPLLGSLPLHTPPVISVTSLDIPFQVVGLTILANAAFCSIFYPVRTVIQNVRNKNATIRHPIRTATMIKIPVSELQNHHGHIVDPRTTSNEFSMNNVLSLFHRSTHGLNTEFIKDYLQWRQDVSDFKDIENLRLNAFLSAHEDWESTEPDEDEELLGAISESDEVWVTPGVPFIIPITLGLLLTLYVGDIMYWIVVSLN